MVAGKVATINLFFKDLLHLPAENWPQHSCIENETQIKHIAYIPRNRHALQFKRFRS
jgi:hypothetical protein